MSWLTDYVRPKLSALIGQDAVKEVPDNLWHKCSSCEKMLFHRELEDNLCVCTHCGHHMRLNAHERLKMLFDLGDYTSLELPAVPKDPLRFKDTKKYADRLRQAQENTGLEDALIIAHGKIQDQKAVVAAFSFSFMGGSMGMAVGEGLIKGAEYAIRRKLPYIVIPSSGGARMQEGTLSLMQLPRTVVAVEMMKEARLPYIVVLADPTTGGVSASFAMLGDVTLAESGAIIGFAGRRVIEETIRQKLPDDFQKAEYLHAHGMVDRVVARKDLPQELGKLIALMMGGKTRK